MDPDIANQPRNDPSSIFHMLFLVSECDYISYFSGFGKGTFLNTFYQHADFISGNQYSGRLCDISEDSKHTGFLSFLRLIGCLYFKKHYSAVASLKSVETPQQLLNSFALHPREQHETWYNMYSWRKDNQRRRAHAFSYCHVVALATIMLGCQNVAELH